MELNRLQKEEITAWSEYMVADANKILSSYNVIAAIDPVFAGYAMAKIIQKLQKPLDKKAQLDDLNEMWNMGQLEKEYYEKTKAYIETQYT